VISPMEYQWKLIYRTDEIIAKHHSGTCCP
jgi:hypothetical protein